MVSNDVGASSGGGDVSANLRRFLVFFLASFHAMSKEIYIFQNDITQRNIRSICDTICEVRRSDIGVERYATSGSHDTLFGPTSSLSRNYSTFRHPHPTQVLHYLASKISTKNVLSGYPSSIAKIGGLASRI